MLEIIQASTFDIRGPSSDVELHFGLAFRVQGPGPCRLSGSDVALGIVLWSLGFRVAEIRGRKAPQ